MTRSDDLMGRLARINPTTAFVIAVILMVAGLILPGIVGAALLVVLAVAAAGLTFTTWPVQPPATRVLRITMLVALVAIVVIKAT